MQYDQSSSKQAAFQRLSASSILEAWQKDALARLNQAFQLSPHLSFNDQSRLVFFSDCHRGTNSRDDFFAPNASLFHHALMYYARQDYTYIEVGDGDELWHNRHFSHIRQTYGQIFNLLFHLWEEKRLHFIIGNHESQKGFFDPIEKGGIPVYQGLVLQYENRKQTLFAVHGHQAGQDNDRFWWFSRFYSRYIWKHFLPLFESWHHFVEPEAGFPDPHRLEKLPNWLSEWILNKARKIESVIKLWMQAQQKIVICGHTHMAAFPALGELPYFNTGNCLSPGYITGLEIERGHIALVKWTAQQNQYKRHILQITPLALLGFGG